MIGKINRISSVIIVYNAKSPDVDASELRVPVDAETSCN